MTFTFAETPIEIGDVVINCVVGYAVLGTVIAFHPITHDPILQDAHGAKWVADIKKCVRCA